VRIRLLIDTTLDMEQIPKLAELIADQPTCLIEINGWGQILGGRFMGAQPVHVDELEALEGRKDQ
jgi:hypothetical protein